SLVQLVYVLRVVSQRSSRSDLSLERGEDGEEVACLLGRIGADPTTTPRLDLDETDGFEAAQCLHDRLLADAELGLERLDRHARPRRVRTFDDLGAKSVKEELTKRRLGSRFLGHDLCSLMEPLKSRS